MALEFAILAIPFFLWILFIFELGYDLFVQEALDGALHAAVRQIQTGNAQGLANGQVFINQYLCPAAKGLLECDSGHMTISVRQFVPGAPGTTCAPDFSCVTTGAPPPTAFNDSTGGNFCNAQPKELVLVQALYLGPSFVAGLLPGVISASYNNNIVHPTLSTAGFVVEPYSATPLSGKAAPAC